MDSQIKQDFLDFVEFIQFVFHTVKIYSSRRKGICPRQIYLKENLDGFFASTFQNLKNDSKQFFVATRMHPTVFQQLYDMIAEKLEKSSAAELPSDCRLFLTLIYLAHGPSGQYLSFTFRIPISVIRRIVLETCKLIWDQLCPIYMPSPSENKWHKVAKDFNRKCNLPNCVGAIDGKHISIKCPPNSGTQFSNSKGAFSIILLAVSDANHNFTAVDIGACGSQSEGRILGYTEFGKKLLDNTVGFPRDAKLPNSQTTFPFYLVGNAGFALKSFLMRPYPGVLLSEEKLNFNKRLSRAQKTIENAFGVLTARWTILRGTLDMSPKSAEKIACATVVLHNFVKMHDSAYCPPNFVDRVENGEVVEGLWRTEVSPLQRISRLSSNNSSQYSFFLRDNLCKYLFLNKSL